MFAVVLTAASSVMLKFSAIRPHSSRVREYLNPLVMGAYFIQGLATFMTIYGYRYVPLSIGQVLASSGQILVLILSMLFLKERIGLQKWAGLLIIFSGIYVATIL